MTIKEKNVSKPRVLVVGDVMLDEWQYGEVSRISPEAPIPVFDSGSSSTCLGGAGNVLVNLKALGAEPMIISGISEDKTGHEIKRMVKKLCDDNAFYFNIPISFNKRRICSGQQQIVRIDTGKGAEISDQEVDEYLERLEGKVDIVLIADYGKGAVTEYLLEQVSDFCYREKIKLLIDPYIKEYYDNEHFYCDMIKLNKDEAEAFTNINIKNEDDIKNAGHILMGLFDTESILLTLGPDGMAYFDKNIYKNDPFRRIDNPLTIYDVCGAGDSVFAALGYIMSENMDVMNMMILATKAGKIAVSKKGTSIVSYDELFFDNK